MRLEAKHTTLLRRLLRTGGAGMAGILFLGGSAWAQAPANKVIHLDDDFFAEVKIGLYLLGLIILMVIGIAVMLKSDPKKLTIKYMLQDFTGANAPDPEMHHEYDGITELDNPVPAWLKGILYGSFVFAFVYLMHYHVLKTGPLQIEEYEIEMAEAGLKYQSVELPDDMLIQITDATRLQGARTIFNETCATCHRTDMGGDSGPNLTDEFWLHGGDIKRIYATITNGVPGKTMVSWKSQIPSQKRLELASYILSLQGSNPPNPREPEGTKAGENDVPPTPDASESDTGEESDTKLDEAPEGN